MKLRLLRKEDQPVGTWAGGTTTQLAIWPEGADYASRRFDWRLSSARIDLEESDFTPLPGFHRILMILEGAIELEHEGIRKVTLNAFDQDSFEGGWKTRSRGRCVDFNLMTAPGWRGTVTALRAGDSAGPDLFHAPGDAFEALYCRAEGLTAKIARDKEAWTEKLRRGDFLLTAQENSGPASLTLESDAKPGTVLCVRVTVGRE